MRAQRFAAILSFGCFVLSALAGLIASDGTRLGWWDYEMGLTILAPAVVLALIGSLAGLVWISSALRRNDSRSISFAST